MEGMFYAKKQKQFTAPLSHFHQSDFEMSTPARQRGSPRGLVGDGIGQIAS
jgi:hypothetical protein